MNYCLADKNNYSAIEILTRECFWNVYQPGCSEHFVIHQMHEHKSHVPDLEYVANDGTRIVGHIIYTTGELAGIKGILSFGPLSVDPQYRCRGIGNELVSMTLRKAKALGYVAVFITGNPAYYHRFGFESASKYGIYMDGFINQEAPFFMVLFLNDIDKSLWKGCFYFHSDYYPSSEEVDAFDKRFPPKKKEIRKGQL